MDAKIVIIKDAKPIDQYVLGTKPLIIGRKSDCDISIKDPAVSGHHARIIVESGLFVIEDMGSTNGVHIGGERIEKHAFKNGDTVAIGEHQLRFMMPEAVPGKAAAKARPEKAQPAAGATPAAPAPTAPEPTAPAAREAPASEPAAKPVKARVLDKPVNLDEAFLMMLSGASKGSRLDLRDTLTTVGEPGIQVAAVQRRPQGHFIVHVDGGKEKDRVPLVNGEPTGFKSRKLEPGDIVEVADIRMEYHA